MDRSNPPVTADLQAPSDVKTVLQQLCYDCHSNETRWLWYSDVAPVSWLVVHDVNEAREHLNFSEWGRMDAGDRREMREEIWGEVEEGAMPLRLYSVAHPRARVSESDLQILREWSRK